MTEIWTLCSVFTGLFSIPSFNVRYDYSCTNDNLGCNRQEGNLDLKFLFLITGETADSCGQRDFSNNMFACQWSSAYEKWIYNYIDIRAKALAKN